MKRRILAWILVVGLLLTLVPAYAETDGEIAQAETPVVEETIEAPTADGTDEQANAETVTPSLPEETEGPEIPEVVEPEETEKPEVPEVVGPEETEEPEVPEVIEPEETEEPKEDTPVPFHAEVRIELKDKSDIFFGDEITLCAVVDANADEYTVAWQYYNEEFDANDKKSEEWIACGNGENLTFTVTEVTATRIFRAVVNGQFASKTFSLPKVSEKPVAPDEEETEVGNGDEEETEVGKEHEEDEAGVELPSSYPYKYVRDENGELVLDEAGNPIAIVPEGVDIPVAFLRDEAGNLVLDAAGNPIPTQFIPQTAHKVTTLEDQLDPNRSIDIYADWGEEELSFGMESTLIAVLHGYDNAVYTVRWQTSVDGGLWTDIDGATETRYSMTVTEDNYYDYWRVVVTVTDVIEGESASDASL